MMKHDIQSAFSFGVLLDQKSGEKRKLLILSVHLVRCSILKRIPTRLLGLRESVVYSVRRKKEKKSCAVPQSVAHWRFWE